MKEIPFSEYNPEWPNQYQQEKHKIEKALSGNLFCIHHVGSTAVFGLASKTKIDIIAEVEDIRKTLKQLPLAGYAFQGEWNIPGKYGFTKRGALNVNLHVYPKNHAETVGNLLFRDCLRADTKIRERYAQLKYKLISDPEMKKRNKDSLGFPEYTIEKSIFVENVLESMGYRLPRLLRPVTKIHHEHLAKNHLNSNDTILCLHGVNICGHATILDQVELHLDNLEEDQEVFQKLVNNWLNNRADTRIYR